MKNSRIDLRIPHGEKTTWQAYAQAHGITLSQLIVRAVRSYITNPR